MAFSFKKAETPTFTTKVEIPVPNKRGGHDNQSFIAEFKRTTTDEMAALQEAGMTDEELVRDRLVGWDMEDADTHEKVPFTPETLDAVLEIQPSPKHIALAFFRASGGGKF